MARTNTNTGGGGGGGTVTSVGLTLPNIFSVSGSPVTGSGTLAGSLVNQNASLVFAGPATGAATTPTFRALVAADLPSLGGLYWSLTGNAGTTPGTNFIGTTDDQDLVFKRNGIFAGRLQYNGLNLGNTSFGVNSADGTSIGSIEGLTAIGHNAANGLQPFSDGVTAIGAFAGAHNTPVTTIEFSTFLGSTAGNQNEASEVTIIGESAGNANTGARAVLIGRQTGSQNSGADTIIIGSQNAGASNTFSNSIIMGNAAQAVAENEFAISSLIDHVNFLLNSGAAGTVLTNDGTGRADWQPNLGASSWQLTGNGGLTDGVDNFFGTTNGQIPIRFIVDNINAGQISSPTTANTFLGLYSGDAFSAGSFANGFENTGVGQSSLQSLFDGQRNTALGSHAGQAVISGQDNTLIGYSADVGSANYGHVIALGANAVSTSDQQFVIDPDVTHLNFPLNSTGAEIGYVLTNTDGNGLASWQPNPGANAWLLTGNTGLTDLTDNLLGTTDIAPLRFIINNLPAGYIGDIASSLGASVFLGVGAGENISGGNVNVGIGYHALNANSSGTDNVAIGTFAMENGTDAINGIGIGRNALIANNGYSNIGIGVNSGSTIDTGTFNVGLGENSSLNLVSGSNNVSLGYNSGVTDPAQVNTIALGAGALALTDNEFAIGTQDHINFALNTHNAGDVLTSDGTGIGTWQSPTLNAWGLNGNAGTDGTVNFIGTTDNEDVQFMRDNVLLGALGSGSVQWGDINGSISGAVIAVNFGTPGQTNISAMGDRFSFGGSLESGYAVANNTDFTVDYNDYIIIFLGMSAERTCFLPDLTTFGAGKHIIVKSMYNNNFNVIVEADTSEYIEGNPTLTLTPGQSVTLFGDTSAWHII